MSSGAKRKKKEKQKKKFAESKKKRADYRNQRIDTESHKLADKLTNPNLILTDTDVNNIYRSHETVTNYPDRLPSVNTGGFQYDEPVVLSGVPDIQKKYHKKLERLYNHLTDSSSTRNTIDDKLAAVKNSSNFTKDKLGTNFYNECSHFLSEIQAYVDDENSELPPLPKARGKNVMHKIEKEVGMTEADINEPDLVCDHSKYDDTPLVFYCAYNDDIFSLLGDRMDWMGSEKFRELDELERWCSDNHHLFSPEISDAKYIFINMIDVFDGKAWEYIDWENQENISRLREYGLADSINRKALERPDLEIKTSEIQNSKHYDTGFSFSNLISSA